MDGKSTPLKVGIVGCGRIGAMTPDHVRRSLPRGWIPLSVAEAVQVTTDLEIAALCDVNTDALAQAGAHFQVAACFTDHRKMLDEVPLDIVAVATRTRGRADVIVDASEHGVRGLHVEKPLSRNMAECDRAIDAVVRRGVHLSYGALRRYMEVYREAHRLVTAGEIGDLVEIAIEHGRTTLMWNHPHSVDLLQFFSGDVPAIDVQSTCILEAANGLVVDSDPIVCMGMVRFANGVTGLITSGQGWNVRLSGTKGTLAVIADGSWLELRRLPDRDSSYFLEVSRIDPVVTTSGRAIALAELRDAVSGKLQRLSHRPIDIAHGQRILLSLAYSSLQGGARVRPDDLPDGFTVTGRMGALEA